jgi:hypothetical protein
LRGPTIIGIPNFTGRPYTRQLVACPGNEQ